MSFGQGWKTVLILFASLLTFYVQTWDEYHTHTLTLGVVSGPVEGIVILCLVYAFTGYVGGGSFWHQSMFACLGVPRLAIIPNIIYDLPWTDWYMVQGSAVLIFNTVLSAMNVMAARRLRKEDPIIALYGLAPFFLTWTVIPAYLFLQPVILRQHLVPFVLYVGLVNAYSVGQMITAHLTKSRFPMTNVLVLPLLFGVIDSLGPFLTEHIGLGWPSALGDGQYQIAFMFSCLGLAIGVYGSFVVDVIVTICDYLDIWCLTIKHPYVPEAEEKKVR
jgi:ethanolaminephosphotransferase